MSIDRLPIFPLTLGKPSNILFLGGHEPTTPRRWERDAAQAAARLQRRRAT